jgi:hypothetical protein
MDGKIAIFAGGFDFAISPDFVVCAAVFHELTNPHPGLCRESHYIVSRSRHFFTAK